MWAIQVRALPRIPIWGSIEELLGNIIRDHRAWTERRLPRIPIWGSIETIETVSWSCSPGISCRLLPRIPIWGSIGKRLIIVD